MQTIYSNRATVLNTTMGEIHVSPFEKFKAFYNMEIFFKKLWLIFSTLMIQEMKNSLTGR